MPRTARIVIPDVPHHITQRGNRGINLFYSDADRLSYLAIFKKQSEKFGLEVHGYCLMSNHVHFVATPHGEDSLAKAVGQAHHMYAQEFNGARKELGHLWHSRFYSCPLDEAHLLNSLIYVDRNPVRAGLVKLPWKWRWSSAAVHIGGDDPGELVDGLGDWWQTFSRLSGWAEIVRDEQSRLAIEEIRAHTRSGKPMGDEEFVRSIERELGYPVGLRPIGRPKKE